MGLGRPAAAPSSRPGQQAAGRGRDLTPLSRPVLLGVGTWLLARQPLNGVGSWKGCRHLGVTEGGGRGGCTRWERLGRVALGSRGDARLPEDLLQRGCGVVWVGGPGGQSMAAEGGVR